jgi:DDE family transposase
MPKFFRGKHELLFIWFILLIACGVGDYKLTTMACYGSGFITEWRFRRLLSASYWEVRPIFIWLISEIIKVLPIPEDKTLYVIVDGSKKEKRSKKNPYMQKGKIRANEAWFFGIRFCVLMIAWGNFRIPVDFKILYPKKHKKYRNENQLFRDMLKRFTPPAWAERVIVMGDAAYASVDNMNYIKKRAKNEWKKNKVFWWFVFAMAKTWKFTDGRSLRDLARHVKKECYEKTFISKTLSQSKLCYWTFSKCVSLRHIGDVTIVLSKKGRNLGPKNIRVIVTNLPNVTAKQILNIYQRRFMIEVLFRELKSGMGLGKQQVTKNQERIEKSIGCSILAYLLVLKMQHQDILPDQSWSIFGLREKFRYRVIKNQFNHEYKWMEDKLKNAA